MKVAYVVSRFPLVSETFILRELDRVAEQPGIDVELYALFPSRDAVVHHEARRWTERCRRPALSRIVGAAIRWFLNKPGIVVTIAGTVVRDYSSSPRMLGKSLVTAAIALEHAEHMRAASVKHVHAHFATYPALTAWIVHRLSGVPYTVTPHAHDIFVDQAGLRTKLGAAAGVVAVSEYHWMFLQLFGADPHRLWRLSYGVDLAAYRFRPRVVPDEGDVDVVMVSSFRAYKGHRVLLEALAREESRLARLRVEFVGSGPLEGELRALAARLGLAGRCTFSGARDQAYVRRRLDRAHILVQPSIVQENGDTEGLPNTLIEGAAVGVTLVATRVTGVPDLVVDGVSGHLADPRSPSSLAAALERAITAGSAATALQIEARGRVEARHDVNRLAATLVARFSAVGAAANED